MKLLRKTGFILIVGVCLEITLFYIGYDYFLIGNSLKNERREVETSVRRLESLLNSVADDLASQTEDYSMWDDTYEYALRRESSYTSVNFSDSAFTRLNIDMVLIFDKDSRLLFQKGYDRQENAAISVPDDICRQIQDRKEIFLQDSGTDGVKGFISYHGGIAIVAAKPILTSEGTGPVRGSLIMGRFLNESRLKELSGLMNLSVNITRFDDMNTPAADMKMRNGTADKDAVSVMPFSNDIVTGIKQVRDIYGKYTVALKVDIPRTFLRENLKILDTFITYSVVLLVVFAAVVMLLFDRFVVRPVGILGRDIVELGQWGDFSRRLTVKGKDEISVLSGLINSMLDELQKMHVKTEESRQEYRELSERLKVTLDSIGDAVMSVDLEGRITMLSKAAEDLFSCVSSEVLGKRICELLNLSGNGNGKDIGDFIDSVFKNGRFQELDNDIFINAPGAAADGAKKIVRISVAPIKADEGRIEGAVLVLRDITDKKAKEGEIRYLSAHDRLTGLYNRAYLEHELKQLDREMYYPLGVIIGDLNGLKLTNDLFGHLEGDRLLRGIAEILVNNCRKGDVIARWGGDEFAIILPLAGEETLIETCEKIASACNEAKGYPIQPSIALGYAVKSGPLQDIFYVLNEAEERMYRHKLLESRSTRSSIVSSLGKTLFEKSIQTEEHAERLLKISSSIGKELGLSSNELDELKLLSILHDIGKIAIPESILTKTGQLTPEEREEVKKHAEIGCRIAESSRDLSHISKYILFHHERWDGKGYPLGLTGNAIPKLSRIISILDAYDAMTHLRPYRKPVSRQEAIEEIKRCSGTQFDPELVKVFLKVIAEEGQTHAV